MSQEPTEYQKVAFHINGLWLIFNSIFDGIWDFLQRGRIMRRIAFVLMWWITFEAFNFCYEAAEKSNWDAATIGACFGILTPVSALQAAIMKFYSDARNTDIHKEKEQSDVGHDR